MHPRHSATLGRLVDYVEVQHALVATVYEKCRLRKSEEHSWQVSLSPIFWLLGIITSIKLRLFILWSNLSRYHAEQQWEEASHLMGHIFKLMRWILVSTCYIFFCNCSRRNNSWPIRFISVWMSLCRYLLIITQAKIQLMFHEVGYGTSQDELFTLEPQFLQYLEVLLLMITKSLDLTYFIFSQKFVPYCWLWDSVALNHTT